jgi:hypothetical protein
VALRHVNTRASSVGGSQVSVSTRSSSARTPCVGRKTLIYRRTGNLRAVKLLLLGHTKIESTVRYLGIEMDDAIEIAEKVEV